MRQREFAPIYDEQVWRVYGFFAYRLRSRQDAEDLTQLTFERALKAWSKYDERRAGVTTWLIAIARNLLIDHLRAASAGVQTVAGELDLEALPDAPDAHSIGLDPDLERALCQLSPRELELIALRFGGDLTGREIADMTGLSLANVQQILSRALRRMRTTLDGSDLQQSVTKEPAA
ncbi:MAG: sigma-70 family RNA polymerase sigma factor [Conexibacteraceae bacterium]|nr:sigma-70 family RNA polymerase sigma factor [Conexibacteraceae bacterium]